MVSCSKTVLNPQIPWFKYVKAFHTTWHLRKRLKMQIINMHCYLMQWLLTTSSTHWTFSALFTKSVLCLIIEVLWFDGFFLKLVVPALWRGEYMLVRMRFLLRNNATHCHGQSVVTPIHLCLWRLSPTATTKQWLSITLTLRNIWAAVMEWNQIECLFTSQSPCQEGRWRRTESQCFSPQHIRCSLNSMVLAHRWLIPCRHKTCLTSEWHFTGNFILWWAAESTMPGFVNT